MRIRSDSFEPGQPIPATYAVGAPDGFGGNRNPHLAWDDVPAGTRSFALLCIDPDAPTDPSLAGKDGVEIPVEHPRGAFHHWTVADLPATCRAIAEGSASDGVTKGGKRMPPGPAGARQGRNDYTGWFAGHPELAGDWRGYDGPYPPPNDLRTHRYFFRLFALDVATLDLPDGFDAAALLRAIQGHVLAEATVWGSYALHPHARPA
jgi:Raf kinase inhibitor-like YbhB/YbcL family protein